MLPIIKVNVALFALIGAPDIGASIKANLVFAPVGGMKRGRQGPRALKKIRYGSHFSGMEMYAIAFRKLVATFLHVLSCDSSQPRQLLIFSRIPAHSLLELTQETH